ncbi:hypothetical protein C8F04DRAFT_951167 [Mycena alexandri]|uniref:Uncharacterized protein n=1 Tax=Mycena alexandri TaxID=1745969 RepID=A0AAD6T447_9AGAR|nr:hypothetical protein C8F04DRAFT_951167 [Mycena alexandri]
MSDEVSGPEGDDETEKAVWKTRITFKAGYDANGDVLNTKSFLEVLGCDWRSTEMSDALHEMATIAFDALGPRQKKAFQYICVRNTGRSGTRVPDRAPYKFGMNHTWYEKYKDHPKFEDLLDDWNNYPDLEEFHSSNVVVQEVVMEETRAEEE